MTSKLMLEYEATIEGLTETAKPITRARVLELGTIFAAAIAAADRGGT